MERKYLEIHMGVPFSLPPSLEKVGKNGSLLKGERSYTERHKEFL